jgi:geranylgeranyl diphosphate synthase, type II
VESAAQRVEAPPEHALPAHEISAYLDEVRELVLEQIDHLVPRGTRYDADLYNLIREYPFRPAKMLRPALAIAVCRAAGGRLEAVLPTAAVFELFHNAFLIHDDVEDASWMRRSGPTLHRAHGVPIAVNVGDAMLAMCLRPLLDNTRAIGVGRALRVLSLVATMSSESAKGQALELGWIRRRTWDLTDRDYFRMVHQKTSWYTFLAPAAAGAIVAGCDATTIQRIRLWATQLGLAFQIQDDLLNLEAADGGYGKEGEGDLYEGKRTLVLLAALRHARPAVRRRAMACLERPRPASPDIAAAAGEKTAADIQVLRGLIDDSGAVAYARSVAARRCRAAERRWRAIAPRLDSTGAVDSVHAAFLSGLTRYVIDRTR